MFITAKTLKPYKIYIFKRLIMEHQCVPTILGTFSELKNFYPTFLLSPIIKKELPPVPCNTDRDLCL